MSYDREYYKVLYEDGDQEEYMNEEIEDIVLTSDLAAVEVGSRVAVYWPNDDQYYEATVTRERNTKKAFYLEYDDGSSEWIDLRQHRFRLLLGTRRRWDEDEILGDVESDVVLGSHVPNDPDLDGDDNDTYDSELKMAANLTEDKNREISDGSQRVTESAAPVAKPGVASRENSPKYPVGTKVKKVCVAERNS